MSGSGRFVVSCVVGATLAAGVSSCGASVSPTPVATTVTVTAPEPRDTTPDADPRGNSSDTGATSSAAPAAPTAGRLGLGSFFNPTGWQENRYNVADKKLVQGIRGELVPACGDHPVSPELELRLGSAYRQLTFSVGQAQDSASSQRVMTVEVWTDNEKVDLRKVPFNKVQPFTVDVTGVSALRVRFVLDPEDRDATCSGESIVSPVLFDATLQ